jgi:asparagine synthase (glutamine-hydrolysing)
LRELAKKYLPEELIYQPKRGFEIPLRSWIENDLKEITYDYLSGSTYSETFIKKQFLSDLIDNKVKVSPEKRAKMLWSILALEIWYTHCYKEL